MLTSRMLDIFKCIVEEFIQTAEPVGSKTLVEKYNLPYSTATIRNEMMELENEGLIEKTHTSSGRVPSTLGYRYYVDHFLEEKLDENLELTITNAFRSQPLNTNEAIKKSVEVLSKMTNLTSMVLGPDAQSQRLEHIKLFPIDERTAVCVLITDTGHTENRMFEFDEAVTSKDIESTCEILNSRLKGTPINQIVQKMEALKPILEGVVERHEILFRAFVSAFIKFASENVYYSGKENMLYQPEFADVERLKQMMTMLEDSDLWRNLTEKEGALLLKKSDNSSLVWKDDMAVISNTIKVTESEEAQLMLVGPSRMNYDYVMAIMEKVSSEVEKILGKGGK